MSKPVLKKKDTADTIDNKVKTLELVIDGDDDDDDDKLLNGNRNKGSDTPKIEMDDDDGSDDDLLLSVPECAALDLNLDDETPENVIVQTLPTNSPQKSQEQAPQNHLMILSLCDTCFVVTKLLFLLYINV